MVAYYTPQTAGEPHHAYRDSTLPFQYFSATGERDENPRNSILVQLGDPRLGQGNLRVGSDRHGAFAGPGRAARFADRHERVGAGETPTIRVGGKHGRHHGHPQSSHVRGAQRSWTRRIRV